MGANGFNLCGTLNNAEGRTSRAPPGRCDTIVFGAQQLVEPFSIIFIWQCRRLKYRECRQEHRIMCDDEGVVDTTPFLAIDGARKESSRHEFVLWKTTSWPMKLWQSSWYLKRPIQRIYAGHKLKGVSSQMLAKAQSSELLDIGLFELQSYVLIPNNVMHRSSTLWGQCFELFAVTPPLVNPDRCIKVLMFGKQS